ncbi:hypothetical protein HZB97_00890, partial [Candidatus Gottesmanbacteria bacterium]|nr:hypothetical protein [Candidatus Gottesmanbacteria bacterium]
MSIMPNTNPFSGSIDEMRISLFDRTPEAIKQDAQRYPYGVYTSQVLDLTSSVSSIDSLQW